MKKPIYIYIGKYNYKNGEKERERENRRNLIK